MRASTQQQRMELQLVGYFAKRIRRPPGWLVGLPLVEQIASVSECISPGPDGWIDAWKHNEMWLFDDEHTTIELVPPDDRPQYSLFAYKMLPMVILDGAHHALSIPRLHVEPLADDYVLLGYDAVSRSAGTAFECSPLSCNLRATDFPVNKYCLVDSLPDAIQMAAAFSRGQAEPGPYVVVEVWAKGAPKKVMEPTVAGSRTPRHARTSRRWPSGSILLEDHVAKGIAVDRKADDLFPGIALKHDGRDGPHSRREAVLDVGGQPDIARVGAAHHEGLAARLDTEAEI